MTQLAAIDRTDVLVAMSIVTLTLPLVLLVVSGLAWWRRNRGGTVGRGLEATVTFLAGACGGTFVLWTGSSLLAGAPFYVVVIVLTITSIRRGRRVLAGWLIAGFATPWTVLWFVYVLALAEGANFEPGPTWGGFLAGLAIVLVGLFVVSRGDLVQSGPRPSAPPGQPGSRSLGGIGHAISEPSRIGPFRTNDLAAVVTIVVVWSLVAFLPTPSRFINLGVSVVLGAVLATEAYIRAMPTPMRRAYEAFSWLGEWELEQARLATGGRVPTTRRAAEQWLALHPDLPELRWIRAEVLLLANRIEEARAAVAGMPAGTAPEVFEHAATFELVDWMAGGPGDLPALEAAVADLGPLGSDERLRGEVSLAAARVRRLVAEGPVTTATIAPLIEARRLLGTRADGQVGRALRKRLIPAFVVVGLIFGSLLELLPAGGLA